MDSKNRLDWAQKRLKRLVAMWWPRGSIVAFFIGLLLPPSGLITWRMPTPIEVWQARCLQGFAIVVIWTLICLAEWVYLKMLIGANRQD